MEYLKVVLSLIGVLMLIFATYFGVRWMEKKVQYKPGASVKVIETVGLGTDKSLVIINIGEKYMMLGVSQQHIEKIADIDKEDIKVITQKAQTERQPFSASLAKVLSEKGIIKGGDKSEK